MSAVCKTIDDVVTRAGYRVVKLRQGPHQWSTWVVNRHGDEWTMRHTCIRCRKHEAFDAVRVDRGEDKPVESRFVFVPGWRLS